MQQVNYQHGVFCTDVSPYPRLHRKAPAYTLAVVNQGKLVNSATILTPSSAAEEANAIALAVRMAYQQGISAYVVSDSRAACCMYMKGVLPTRTIQILGSVVRPIRVRMITNLFIAKLHYLAAEPHCFLP
ncbi:hypothetical protein HPB50_000084 [Hyalomma asiaticum]|uniref:Uncharacterized protein n=1 Tax=Hyalomma asiaticum TaxID=266040 RepID=A0ACB7TCF2_HYAAI|nr:hypothetical protein HPB50_000084 [Hyalomma asiaticum]